MNTVTIQRQADEPNLFALLQGERKLGEVKVNEKYGDQKQVELTKFAANFLQARFPITPHNAVWEVGDEPNRLTLVEQSNNKQDWLLVLTH
jgi:hypothetical protein